MPTQDNLQAACAGESQANRKYLAFAAKADAEGNRAAVASFRNANAVEKIHYDLYTEALETLAGGKDFPAAAIHVCDVCGNTVVGEAPDKCPVCGAPKTKFKEVV
jgi:rubrerythrin